jgi:hypothetical protein
MGLPLEALNLFFVTCPDTAGFLLENCMTFSEALGAQALWLTVWFYWLAVAVFILPLSLFIWRETRVAALATVAANVFNAITVPWMYGQMGYVKLLGLPHIIVWTPLAWYLWRLIKRADIAVLPRKVMMVVLATLLVSLAFDFVDVARYVLGERMPMAGTLKAG